MNHWIYKSFFAIFISLLGCASTSKISVNAPVGDLRRPKAIIGITVDQMRYDFIEKYWNDFGTGGFKRLVNEGFFCRNMQYNYMPTYTGPGHASIFTGSTPAYHGIIQNDWYERSSGKMIYCSSDSMVVGVGTSSAAGKMSPHYLLASTIGDELKLFSNEQSKVFGIAMKDRGAILPAGRMADAAYWFVGGEEGKWATSNWYMDSLPRWVNEYNNAGVAEDVMSKSWTLELPESSYTESMADNNAYETAFKGTLRPVFPYNLAELRKMNGNYDLIKATPYGNALTIDFAKKLIEQEGIGLDEYTDMLCMSFSATDYIGHQFGIHSRELHDCYVKLDKQLAEFLAYLDQKFGVNNYTIFLSADHGGAPTPSYVETQSGTAGYWKSDNLEQQVEVFLKDTYGDGDWVINESNQNIFLNHTLIKERKLNLKIIQNEVAQFVAQQSHVLKAFTAYDLDQSMSKTPFASMVQLGYSQKLSGDIIYILEPGFMEYGMTGTTHGSPFAYDAHVPGIFFGYGVVAGETYAPYHITDIAPTISSIAKISFPNACIGVPVIEAIKKK